MDNEKKKKEDKHPLRNQLQGFECLKGKLFPYQVKGLRFLCNACKEGRKGVILADEMGLGKSIQVISFLAYINSKKLKVPSTLLVVPLNLVDDWVNKIHDWAPWMTCLKYHRSEQSEQQNLREVKTKGGILITTYGMMMRRKKDLSTFSSEPYKWDFMVCDEAHKLKNEKTQTYKVSSSIQVRFRILITGTPIQNNLKELWNLLSLISETYLVGTYKTFRKVFEKPITRGREADSEASERALAEELMNCLKEKIKPVWLRRTKDQLPKLPDKREFVLWIKLSPGQEAAYRHQISINEQNVTTNLSLLHRLCELCSQPVKSDESSLNSAESLVAHSGKLAILIPLLKTRSSEGRKTLVFFQYVETLKIVLHTLSQTEWGHRTVLFMDGTVDPGKRAMLLRSFQKGSKSILLLTVKVGAEGLTLTAADCVILVEPSWNQSTDAQAVDRSHRIGQRREVEVYRLITCGTIEEKIYRRQLFKDSLVRQVVGDDQNPLRYFTRSELMELTTLGETQYSSTQLQLERQNSKRLSAGAILGRQLAEQVSGSLCGISDHGKLLKANQDKDLEAEMEKLHIADDVQRCKEEIEDEAHLKCKRATDNGTGHDKNQRKSLAVHRKGKLLCRASITTTVYSKQHGKYAPGLPRKYKCFSSPFSGSTRRKKCRPVQYDTDEGSLSFAKDKTKCEEEGDTQIGAPLQKTTNVGNDRSQTNSCTLCSVESNSDDASPARQRDGIARENSGAVNNSIESCLSSNNSQHCLSMDSVNKTHTEASPDESDHSAFLFSKKKSVDISVGNIDDISVICIDDIGLNSSTPKSVSGTDAHLPLETQSMDQSQDLIVFQTPVSKLPVQNFDTSSIESCLSVNSTRNSLVMDSVNEDSQDALNETHTQASPDESAFLSSKKKNSVDISVGNIDDIGLSYSSSKSVSLTNAHLTLDNESKNQSQDLGVVQAPISKPPVQNFDTSSFSDIRQHISMQKAESSEYSDDTDGQWTDIESSDLSKNDKSDDSGLVTHKKPSPIKHGLTKSSDIGITTGPLNNAGEFPIIHSQDPQTEKDEIGSSISFSVSCNLDDFLSKSNSKADINDAQSKFSANDTVTFHEGVFHGSSPNAVFVKDPSLHFEARTVHSSPEHSVVQTPRSASPRSPSPETVLNFVGDMQSSVEMESPCQNVESSLTKKTSAALVGGQSPNPPFAFVPSTNSRKKTALFSGMSPASSPEGLPTDNSKIDNDISYSSLDYSADKPSQSTSSCDIIPKNFERLTLIEAPSFDHLTLHSTDELTEGASSGSLLHDVKREESPMKNVKWIGLLGNLSLNASGSLFVSPKAISTPLSKNRFLADNQLQTQVKSPHQSLESPTPFQSAITAPSDYSPPPRSMSALRTPHTGKTPELPGASPGSQQRGSKNYSVTNSNFIEQLTASVHDFSDDETEGCALLSPGDRSYINYSVTQSSSIETQTLNRSNLHYSSPKTVPVKETTLFHESSTQQSSPELNMAHTPRSTPLFATNCDSSANVQSLKHEEHQSQSIKPSPAYSSFVRLQYSCSRTAAGSIWAPGSALMSERSHGFVANIQAPRQMQSSCQTPFSSTTSPLPIHLICDQPITPGSMSVPPESHTRKEKPFVPDASYVSYAECLRTGKSERSGYTSSRNLHISEVILPESSNIVCVSEDSGTVRGHAESCLPDGSTPNSHMTHVTTKSKSLTGSKSVARTPHSGVTQLVSGACLASDQKDELVNTPGRESLRLLKKLKDL